MPEQLNCVTDACHVSTPLTLISIPPILTTATYPNTTITTGVPTVNNVETVKLHKTTQNDSEEREEREGM
jgi:hypothetical protein